MGIQFDKKRNMYKLDTDYTTYIIGVTQEGYVGHVYYGKRMNDLGGKYLLRTNEPPYTPEVNKREKSAFLDFFPLEYPTGGVGDYRESCLDVRDEHGCMGSEIFYQSHTIEKGKPGDWKDCRLLLERMMK